MSAPPRPAFDRFADRYNSHAGDALSVTGEGADHFARARVAWLARCLAGRRFRPGKALDFGCGVGTSGPLLLDAFSLERVTGVDVSGASLEAARKTHGAPRLDFVPTEKFAPAGDMDLVFCNGVFHHVPPPERDAAARMIFAALRPGGVFAFWENNPWNPGTRYIMKNCAFDHDAVTLSAPESRRLLSRNGFRVLSTDFLFIFPKALSLLRVFEPWVSALPLGGQYQVLAQKPADE